MFIEGFENIRSQIAFNLVCRVLLVNIPFLRIEQIGHARRHHGRASQVLLPGPSGVRRPVAGAYGRIGPHGGSGPGQADHRRPAHR